MIKSHKSTCFALELNFQPPSQLSSKKKAALPLDESYKNGVVPFTPSAKAQG
jgi:hypothetical protein